MGIQRAGIRFLVGSLANHFKLVQYDSRGQGLSARGLPDDHTIDGYTRDLVAVFERLRLESAILISGLVFWRVAVQFAAAFPGRCGGLILYRPDHPVQASRLPRHPLEDIVTSSWPTFLHTMISTYPLVRGAEVRVSDLQQTTTQADYLRMIRAVHAHNAGEALKAIRIPVLVIAERVPGMEDADSLADAAHQIASLMPDARLAIVEGYGETFISQGTEQSRGIRLIEDFIARLPAREMAPPPGERSTSELSAREAEVLRLLAMGKSNAQIAEALVISPNTVNRHVSNIYTKTGAANRAEAASYATRNGIV